MKFKPALLLTFLLAACASDVTTPAPTATATLTVPTVTSVPTITSTPETPASEPPACTFPLAGTTMEESTPESYTFSEPRVVLSSKYSVDIAGWLPDSQNALILPMEDYVFDGTPGYLQTIELFNPDTKKVQIYATRRNLYRKGLPAWNPILNAVIYPSPNVLGRDSTGKLNVVEQVQISYGNPNETQVLVDDLPRKYVVLNSIGNQVVYLKENERQIYQLYTRVMSQGIFGKEQLILFDLNWFGEKEYPVLEDIAWNPDASQMLFYSVGSKPDRTILLNTNTGQSCMLGVRGWVPFARWSPNGRYLGIIRSDSPMFSLAASYALTILDTVTGKFYEIDSTKVGSPEMRNCCRHIMGDFSWAPDNHHLIVVGIVDVVRTGSSITFAPIERLYLIDFLSGEVDNIFPSYEFYSGEWGTKLSWSPDGTKILANCPTEKQGRLCYIPVHINGK